MRSVIARSHIRRVHLDQWQNAQKDTMVCKDLIFYLVKKNFLSYANFMADDEEVKEAVNEAVTQAVYEDNPSR